MPPDALTPPAAEGEEVRFLDVPTLLDRSQPRHRGGWGWYGLGGFALIVMCSTLISQQSGQAQNAVRAFAMVAMVGLVVALMMVSASAVRLQRTEQAQIEAIEELVQLRRWSQAAVLLNGLLSQPTRTPAARAQGLMYLTSVLARYHRYGDAIKVQEHLLGHVRLDDNTAYALKLGRAMAMLQESHLADADRAISDLRRLPAAAHSAGLALVEIYRDVTTGHPAEAIERFDARLPLMRTQLGHRVADGWAMVARAYDLLDRAAEAQTAYTNATLLMPPVELARRYPEVAGLTGKYTPADPPR